MVIHRCEVTLLQTFDDMILAQHLRYSSSILAQSSQLAKRPFIKKVSSTIRESQTIVRHIVLQYETLTEYIAHKKEILSSTHTE